MSLVAASRLCLYAFVGGTVATFIDPPRRPLLVAVLNPVESEVHD